MSAAIRLYPAIDIRDGRAVRLLQGDYDRETAYDADPVDAARRWVDGGARDRPRRRPRRGPGGHPRQPRGRRPDRRRGRRPGPARRRPPRSRRRRGRLRRGGRAGRPRHRRPARSRPASASSPAPTASGSSHRSTPARAASRSRAGSEATDTAVEDAIADLGARGIRRFVFTPVEVDGTLAGPGLDGLGAVLGACAGAGPS